MKISKKTTLIFSHALTFVGGIGIGGALGYFLTKDKFAKENQEEIAALSKHYEEYYSRVEVVDAEVVEEPNPLDDIGTDLEPVEVNTSATNYTKYYKGASNSKEVEEAIRKRARDISAKEAPSEDDDEEFDDYEEKVVEITKEEFDKGLHPYKEIEYLPEDGSLEVVDWGDDETLVEQGRMDLLQVEEAEILDNVRPMISSTCFDHEAYMDLYLLDKSRGEQYHVGKRYGENYATMD